ncbi:MAG TPA: RdgB/HAM1 family non-canonical purine NTP pyrophosphatase [Sphingobacteriaceae bacterium]|nr:RdgB/HAM1 family non-canonical purine NTP pyrophosphatase [Sphingobacteriaceae bacterium]
MISSLVFATNNQHKIEEVQHLVGSLISLKSLNDINCNEDIPETGATFKENASQKSHYIFEHYHTNCFSDDSGLIIDALHGEPGVYSARYSGTRDMEQNLQLVLNRMKDVENRSARFKTVISLILNGEEYIFEGVAEGTITPSKNGSHGFGYDPIFQPEGYNITFAEMDLGEKNRISHRAKAIKELVAFLKNY